MRSLLMKDYYVVMKQMKLLILMIIFIGIVNTDMLGLMLLYVGAILPVTARGYDERAKWDEFAVMLPYTRKQLVISKYLLGYIGITVATLLNCIIGLVIGIFIPQFEHMSLGVLGAMLASVLIFMPINTAIIFKAGAEKSRIAFFVFVFGGATLIELMSRVDPFIVEKLQRLPVGSVILGIVLLNIGAIYYSIKCVVKN